MEFRCMEYPDIRGYIIEFKPSPPKDGKLSKSEPVYRWEPISNWSSPETRNVALKQYQEMFL